MEESTRLVDYFVIAGYNHNKRGNGISNSNSGGFNCQGTILQRFPETDWDDCPFNGEKFEFDNVFIQHCISFR